MTAHVRPTATSSQIGTPVRQESLRTLNLELVFRQILQAAGPISRTELAMETGLTRPTITRIVEELFAGRLIAEAGVARDGKAGRPRVGLTLSEKGPSGLGLDIRADGLAACVVDLTGTVRQLTFTPCSRTSRPAEDILQELARIAEATIDAVAAQDLTVVTATLAIPGPVHAGVVRFAPALGWRNIDVGAFLRDATRHLDIPIDVGNEAHLAALGELYAGHTDLTSFAYISGGLSIGAGIVLNGVIMAGARGWSGELGHVNVQPDGRPCPCGSHGCLQTYADLKAILGDQPIPDGSTPDATIFALADKGSPDILAALDTAAGALGVALSDLLNIIDVDTVLLGGSYSLLSSWLINTIATEIQQRVLTAGWAPIAIRPAMLGPDAAVIGAALTSIDHIRQAPSAWLAQVPSRYADRRTASST